MTRNSGGKWISWTAASVSKASSSLWKGHVTMWPHGRPICVLQNLPQTTRGVQGEHVDFSRSFLVLISNGEVRKWVWKAVVENCHALQCFAVRVKTGLFAWDIAPWSRVHRLGSPNQFCLIIQLRELHWMLDAWLTLCLLHSLILSIKNHVACFTSLGCCVVWPHVSDFNIQGYFMKYAC